MVNEDEFEVMIYMYAYNEKNNAKKNIDVGSLCQQ